MTGNERVRLTMVVLAMVLCVLLYAFFAQRPSHPAWGTIVDARGVITWVYPNSPADLAGLRPGDRLQLPVVPRSLALTSLDRRGHPIVHSFPEPPASTWYGLATLLVSLCSLGVYGACWTYGAARRDSTLIGIAGPVAAIGVLSLVGAQSGYTWLFQYWTVLRSTGFLLWGLALALCIPFDWFQYRWIRRGYGALAVASCSLAAVYVQGTVQGRPPLGVLRVIQAETLLVVAAVTLAQTVRWPRITATQRAQRRYLLTGFLVGVLPIAAFVILPRLATGQQLIALDPLLAFADLAIAIGLMAALLRADLLLLHVGARRGIVRFALSLMLALGLVLIAAGLRLTHVPVLVAVMACTTLAFWAAVALLPLADRVVEGVLAPGLARSRALALRLAPDLKGKVTDLTALTRTIEQAAQRLYPAGQAFLLVREAVPEAVFAVPSRSRVVALPALSRTLMEAGMLARRPEDSANAQEWDALDAIAGGSVARLFAMTVDRDLVAFLAVVPSAAGAPPMGWAAIEGLEFLVTQTTLFVSHARLHHERSLETAMSSTLSAAIAQLAATMVDPQSLPDQVVDALSELPHVAACAMATWEARGRAVLYKRGTAPVGLLDRLADSALDADAPVLWGSGSALVVPLRGDGGRLGALYVEWQPGRPIRAAEARLLGIFGHAVALTLENERLFARTAGQAERNEHLYQMEQQRARAAEELARLRSDFVDSVSHELRTPLTAILGNAEVLKARWHVLADQIKRERLDRIIYAANRQQGLVEELLLLSRLDAGVSVADCRDIALAPLVDDAVAEVRDRYPGQTIDLSGPAESQILADPVRTLQILVNLLDNAAKYSPEGCPIAVTWSADGECASIRVRDRGPGVPATGRDLLFTRFGRVPGSKLRAGRVGTGLGLYLGRQLAEAMGGSLQLETTGPEGSTFLLQLPRVASSTNPDDAV